MNVWTYLGNNWQGIWRALIGCIGLNVLIRPMVRYRAGDYRYRARKAWSGRVENGNSGAEGSENENTKVSSSRAGNSGATGSGNANVSSGSSRQRIDREDCAKNERTAGKHRRMILSLVMTVAVITIKLHKFRFYVDMPLTVVVFAIYLVFMEAPAHSRRFVRRNNAPVDAGRAAGTASVRMTYSARLTLHSVLARAKQTVTGIPLHIGRSGARTTDVQKRSVLWKNMKEPAFPPLDAVYIGCVMFLCMDFCVAAANTVYYRTSLEATLAGKVLVELIFSAVLLVLCVLMRRFVLTNRESRMKGRDFWLLILALTPYLFIRCNSSLYGVDGQVGLALGVTLLLAMAASFGTLVGNRNAILAQQEHTRRLEMEAELREKEKQFEIRRETIDEVNRRYHDMIKYARLYDLEKDPSGLIHYLEERMTENASMGSLIKTGNSMLDMILWEKTEACEQENLRLIPNVDARGLDFVEDFDLHTMVGNALDNAIEAARQVRDVEKREIHIRITRVNQMLFIVVSNFFEGERNWAGGQLQTTKQDTNAHGYGLGNIMQAAGRYDGTAVYDVNGDQFTLTVMLPLPVTS